MLLKSLGNEKNVVSTKKYPQKWHMKEINLFPLRAFILNPDLN